MLHVSPSLAQAYGGPLQVILGFARAGEGTGIAADVAGPAREPGEARWFQAQLPAASRLLTFPFSGTMKQPLSPRLIRWLRQHADGYDVVHVHGLLNPVSSLGARVALRSRAAVVISPFGTMSRYTFSYRRGRLKRLYFAAADAPNLRRAHAVHFTTEAERDEAAWHGLRLESRACVVPPPMPDVPPGPRRRVGRRARRVLFLSRFHPVKGLEALIDAWPRVRSARPDAELLIAGAGEAKYERSLRARAMQRGMTAAGIEFTGFLTGEAKAEAFARADLYALPSKHENFGVAVVEAIAAGLPVVLTSEVQLAPFVSSHGLGVVTSRDPEELARALILALEDTALGERVASYGPAVLERCFGPERVGSLLETMYRTAAGRARGGKH